MKPLLLLLALALPGIAGAQARIEIPVTSDHGLLFAHVRVNDKDAVLLIDTGSQGSMIDSRYSQEQGEQISLQGVGGAVFARLVTVHLSAADHAFDMHCAAAPLSKVIPSSNTKFDGILGSAFLSAFKTVTFDLQRKKVILENY